MLMGIIAMAMSVNRWFGRIVCLIELGLALASNCLILPGCVVVCVVYTLGTYLRWWWVVARRGAGDSMPLGVT